MDGFLHFIFGELAQRELAEVVDDHPALHPSSHEHMRLDILHDELAGCADGVYIEQLWLFLLPLLKDGGVDDDAWPELLVPPQRVQEPHVY
eukprot:CAMPEP_0170554736 /NCGR_PEP_ID=MMETSP0211-20121228/12606_1 /TAXON_ID=311385 /ORGANISM="Pseudokeronopsis sp., Strain OXSARD2" /LENGTH=90 /DNA_ID=CAMNT_0010864043 /DNA_START=835 /DNA_END=1107 /DNA_ORIENTATION=-